MSTFDSGTTARATRTSAHTGTDRRRRQALRTIGSQSSNFHHNPISAVYRCQTALAQLITGFSPAISPDLPKIPEELCRESTQS